MKYIKYFNQETEYNSFLDGEEYIEPHLAFINETNALHFIKKTHKLGDVAYWDGNNVQTCSLENYNESMGAAIGVVVIPSGFAPDGKARIVSLKWANMSGSGQQSRMNWGVPEVDTPLYNYDKVPITNNTDFNSTEVGVSGYIASDLFNYLTEEEKNSLGGYLGIESYVDPIATYYFDTAVFYIPSPYITKDGDYKPNTEYYKTIEGGNVLSDFNGLKNTQTLVGLGTDYEAANACWNYNDGTNSGLQWYLPAMGELGYLRCRIGKLALIIEELTGSFLYIPNANLWSSTELSGESASVLFGGYDGSITGLEKDGKDVHYGFYARPFAILP